MRASAASLLRASPACALRASRPGMLRATALRADAGPNPDPFIKGRLGILTDHNVERWAEMRMNMNREWEWNKKSTRMVLIYVFLVPVALYYFCDYTTVRLLFPPLLALAPPGHDLDSSLLPVSFALYIVAVQATLGCMVLRLKLTGSRSGPHRHTSPSGLV